MARFTNENNDESSKTRKPAFRTQRRRWQMAGIVLLTIAVLLQTGIIGQREVIFTLRHMKPSFSSHVASASSTKPGTTCQETLSNSLKKEKTMAVIVLAANRPDYLRQVLQSLQHQTVSTAFPFQVHIFSDYCTTPACDQVVQLSQDFVSPKSGASANNNYHFHRATVNLGIARLTMWAVDSVMNMTSPAHVDQVLVLEDDHLIGHSYVEAMRYLLEAAEYLPNVGVVNGNFIDTPQHEEHIQRKNRRPFVMNRPPIQEQTNPCHFQIVEPWHGNVDMNAHNVWGWATTRKKYLTIQPTLHRAFHEAGLDDVSRSYKNRDTRRIRRVMNKYCKAAGYADWWQGQDWLRACIFYYHNYTQKLQPTERLMSYIGMDGLHMTRGTFQAAGFDPVSVDKVSRATSNYPASLCSDSICIFSEEKGAVDP